MALVAAIGCLAAVAYAAKPVSWPDLAGRRVSQPAPWLPRPRITRHPARTTLSTRASFRLIGRSPRLDFECRLDGASWRRCKPRVSYGNLMAGSHGFYARARAGDRLSPPVHFTWKQVQPLGFSIEQRPGLGPLYPGAPAQPIPVLIANPNPAPIFVTDLQVSVLVDPVGCSSAENLELRPSAASAAAPIEVPAGGSSSLPAQGPAPTIAMRDLPVSQDACQNARFELAFSGDAHG